MPVGLFLRKRMQIHLLPEMTESWLPATGSATVEQMLNQIKHLLLCKTLKGPASQAKERHDSLLFNITRQCLQSPLAPLETSPSPSAGTGQPLLMAMGPAPCVRFCLPCPDSEQRTGNSCLQIPAITLV